MRHEFQNMTQHIIFTQNEDINIIGNSKLVKVKQCFPNLYSLNFTSRVFHKRLWNEVQYTLVDYLWIELQEM